MLRGWLFTLQTVEEQSIDRSRRSGFRSDWNDRHHEIWLCRVVQYAKYLDQIRDGEEGPDCQQCTDNRLILERTWQVVANEFYDPHGELDQGKWAGALLKTLKVYLMMVWWVLQCIATSWYIMHWAQSSRWWATAVYCVTG